MQKRLNPFDSFLLITGCIMILCALTILLQTVLLLYVYSVCFKHILFAHFQTVFNKTEAAFSAQTVLPEGFHFHQFDLTYYSWC